MPKRYTAKNQTTGESVSFDWDEKEPPSAEDIGFIAKQQRESRIAAKSKIAEVTKPSFMDRLLTSEPVGAALGVANRLGLNQPWHPLDSAAQANEGLNQIFSGEQTPGEQPVEHPRIAGANKFARGVMGAVGPPLTAAGYALNPIGTAGAMMIGNTASDETRRALTPHVAPETAEAAGNITGLAAGGLAGHALTPSTPSQVSGVPAVRPKMYGRPEPIVDKTTIYQHPPTGIEGESAPFNPPQRPQLGPGANPTVVPPNAPRQLSPPASIQMPEAGTFATEQRIQALAPQDVVSGTRPEPTSPAEVPTVTAPVPRPPLTQIPQGRVPLQLPERGEPIPQGPIPVQQPPAGTFANQQQTEGQFNPPAPLQIAAPEVRSQPEQTPLTPEVLPPEPPPVQQQPQTIDVQPPQAAPQPPQIPQVQAPQIQAPQAPEPEVQAPQVQAPQTPQDIVRAAMNRANPQIGEVKPPEQVQSKTPQVQPPDNQAAEARMKNQVLAFAKNRQNLTVDQVQRQFGLPGDVSQNILNDFFKRGLITKNAGKYNYVPMRGETQSPDIPPERSVASPGTTVPERVQSAPSAPETPAKAIPQGAKEPPKPGEISDDEIVSRVDNERQTSDQKTQQLLENGTPKQKQLAGELKNVSNRIDELETKSDSDSLKPEEATELQSLYRKMTKLEADRDYALKPEKEKYGERVANLRSVHAEGKLVGLGHDELSTRAKEEYGVDSMSKLTHQQLSEFEDSLRTERMEKEAQTTTKPRGGVFDQIDSRIDELERREETRALSETEIKELNGLYKKLSKLEGQRGSISFRPLKTKRGSSEPSKFGDFLHKFNGIINSQDTFLEQKPETRPVAEIIHNAQIRGDHFEYFWSRRYNAADNKPFVRQQLADFVESRGLSMGDIKPSDTSQSSNLQFRELLHNIKTEVYDKPAAARARGIVTELPEGFDKDRANWYVNNWTRADLRSEGNRFFKELDSKAASIGARSVLFGSTDLQVLHTARLAAQVWPEVGTADLFRGLSGFVKDPKTAWKEAAASGLMPQQKVPWNLKTPTEKFDSVGNFLDFGNSVVKAITLQSMKAKYPDDPMKAVRETKRVEGVVGRESPIFALEKTPKTVYQFKYWLFKYLGGVANAVRDKEMGKIARYITAAVMLEEMTRHLGVKFYHLNPSTMFSGGSVTLKKAQTTASHLAKGDYESAGKDVIKTLPGSATLLPVAQKLMDGDFEGAFGEFIPSDKSKH